MKNFVSVVWVFCACLLLVGCGKSDDNINPQSLLLELNLSTQVGQEHVTPLSWTLLSSDWYSSKISITQNNRVIAAYELNCNVSEMLNPDPGQLDGEKNKVGLVVTPAKPQGLLITSCRSGAHSKQLSVYDLESKSPHPVWDKTGSYFGEWSVNQNLDLVLSYDEPCNKLNCSASFVQKDVIWKSVP
jgi:hypothetical protein